MAPIGLGDGERGRAPGAAPLGWIAVALWALTLPGCGGCFDPPTPQPAQKPPDPKKKDEKPKPNFEVGRLQILPAEEKGALAGVKPGHWVTAAWALKPNNGDVQGTLESFAAEKDSNRPLPLEGVPHRLRIARPVALAKGQTKFLELLYYVPRREVQQRAAEHEDFLSGEAPARNIFLQGRLVGRGGSLEMSPVVQPVPLLPAHQFLLVVLSAKPEKYVYLRTLDTVKLHLDALDDSERGAPYYQVILPPSGPRVPIPAHPLAWTSVAAVVWDDLDPSLLLPEQRDALLDWLHFGGQLLVSGPDSLAALRGSFLAGYLPALGGASRPIDLDRVAELDRCWTRPEGPMQKLRPLPIVKDKPPLAVELVAQDGGAAVPQTGELVYERQVGRGRVVVTAFGLAAREWVNWPAFDNFWNGCLLRRPPRRYERTSDHVLRVDWADAARFNRLDPRLISRVRYLSRDLGGFEGSGSLRPPPRTLPFRPADVAAYILENGWRIERPLEPIPQQRSLVREVVLRDGTRHSVDGLPAEELARDTPASPTPWQLDSPPAFERGFAGSSDAGVAGWNDASSVAEAARGALKEAAGISVPSLTLVVQVLAIYLVALVPLNWGFFWLIGRVEWAWFAAPVIAVAGAVVVVQQAQLDIGFARSRTEIALLEMQAGHRRGHLTRYTAVYTSLSTSYDLVYDAPSALGQPFAVRSAAEVIAGQSATEVTFERADRPRLRGFQVYSNSTGLLHSEEMHDAGGGLALRQAGGDPALQNDSDLALRGVGLVRRTTAGRIEVAWIGDVAPQSSRPVRFVPAATAGQLFLQRQDDAATRGNPPPGSLNLSPLLALVEDPRGLAAGDVRLIAYTSSPLAGMTVEPAAAQEGSLTLVVAHLAFGPWPAPQSDLNTRADVDLDPAGDAAMP